MAEDRAGKDGVPQDRGGTLLVPEAIAAQARRNASTVAVRFGLAAQTYAQLDARANAIAAALRDAGAGRATFVGLCMQRGLDLPAALLGILKSGAAYLPVDPQLPAARIGAMVDDARPAAWLSTRDIAPYAAQHACPQLLLEDIPRSGPEIDTPIEGQDPAYILYTSGSTGRPKGVVVSHASLANFLSSMAREPGMEPDRTLLAVTTVSFDIAGLELWLPLTCGARVAIADRLATLDGERLTEEIDAQRATMLQATPATWRLLLAAGWKGGPAFRALCGGEPLPRDLAAALLLRTGELWNMYGPTETTIWSTVFRVRDARAPILIGRPIDRTDCYVLDEQGRRCAPGEIGELYIGGAGVALGYHDRAQLTAERFRSDPFRPGSRVYRTGDLARLHPDGQLECLGRTDFQIKVRGFRVEAGEVEATLNDHPAVDDCACGVREAAAGDARLVVWVQPREDLIPSQAELIEHARRRLPDYMVPQHCVLVPELPRLLNGKLDRSRLPDPFAPVQVDTSGMTLEDRLAALWQEVLRRATAPGVDERFFEAGGNSLLAVQVLGRLREALGVRVPAPRFFAAPTIRQFAALLQREYPRETAAWFGARALEHAA